MKPKGFTLVLCLLILSLLLVAGMGLMSVQKFRHQALNSQVLRLQALELARAGLEDVRTKLERDQYFPPSAAGDQPVFTYSEDVTAGGVYLGSYFVTVDRTWAQAPYLMVRVTSSGVVGPRSAPLAQRTIHGEFDENPAHAASYWRWTNWQDDGSL